MRSRGGETARYNLAVLFMMTFVGMPTIFYGDELGIQGATEEEYRRPMPWNNGNTGLRDFFRKAIAMRRALEPLRRGDFRVLSAEQGSGLLVFRRVLRNEAVTVCINAGRVSAELPTMDGCFFWSDGLHGSCLSADGFAVFTNKA